MPRVTPIASEQRRRELSARIQYHMARKGYDNKKMAKLLGVSTKTFIDKKLHAPDEFSLSEIWIMEKAFGCKISEPLSMKDEDRLEGGNYERFRI